METDSENLILPARMVNEYVYCPRLFYIEFVEKVFVHNAHTLQGKAQHKRVDGGNGNLPQKAKSSISELPSSPETIHARSVNLSSDRLGVTAKLDLVEGDAEAVIPVEYKKGRPREGDDGKELWPADKAQLILQILLLRDNGYTANAGLVFYRETRQRVSCELTAEDEAWILPILEEARRTAFQSERPPPLEDSPKCKGCSLVGYCLPDETRLLNELRETREEEPVFQLTLPLDFPDPVDRLGDGPFADLPELPLPDTRQGPEVRRLIAPNHETKALYITTPGTMLGKKGGCLVLKEKGKKIEEFRLHDLYSIAVFGPVTLSSAAIQAACDEDIPIAHFSFGGWLFGMTRGLGMTNVFTRIAQFETASDPDASIYHSRLFVHGKIRNQRTLLMRNHVETQGRVLRDLKILANQALHADSTGILLGLEGAAARQYFSAFQGMIKQTDDPFEPGDDPSSSLFSFKFESRNRRPPADPVNALLSFTYALLSRECLQACYAVGFDPYVGFFHQPRFGRPALALDLMEEFRPLIADSTVITLINNRMLDQSDFVFAGNSVTLGPRGRKIAISAFERRVHSLVTHPVFDYKVSYRRAIELQGRLLAKVVTGEIESYIPFMTR